MVEDLEQVGEAGSSLRNEGEADRCRDRTDSPVREDDHHRSEQGHRAAILLQGHLRHRTSGEDDRLRVAEQRQFGRPSDLRGHRRPCGGADRA